MRYKEKFFGVLLVGVFMILCCAGSSFAETFLTKSGVAVFETVTPKAVYFADRDGRRIKNPITLYGGQRQDLYVYVEDSNNNEHVRGDEGDFIKSTFTRQVSATVDITYILSKDLGVEDLNATISCEEMQVVYPNIFVRIPDSIFEMLDVKLMEEQASFAGEFRGYYSIYISGNNSNTISWMASSLDRTDWESYPEQVFTKPITLIAVQQDVAGDGNAGKEKNASVQLRYEISNEENTTIDSDNPSYTGPHFSAGPANFVIRPSDTGGEGGDNGGGSCSSLGVSAALIIPALVLLSRKK